MNDKTANNAEYQRMQRTVVHARRLMIAGIVTVSAFSFCLILYILSGNVFLIAMYTLVVALQVVPATLYTKAYRRAVKARDHAST